MMRDKKLLELMKQYDENPTIENKKILGRYIYEEIFGWKYDE